MTDGDTPPLAASGLRHEIRERNKRIAVLESQVRKLTDELVPLRKFARRLKREEGQIKGD
jgi:hypothetical protein